MWRFHSLPACIPGHCIVSVCSSSSRNEYYLGGTITLLLQDHHTVSTKSVWNSQYMVTDQHRTTGEQIKHSTLSYSVRERQPEQNDLQFSAEDEKRGHVLWLRHVGWPRASNALASWCDNVARFPLLSAAAQRYLNAAVNSNQRTKWTPS